MDFQPHPHPPKLQSKHGLCGFKDSEREAEKKQAEAVQLEQKMDEMEKVMKELEQRYVCVYLILCVC